MGTLHMAYLQSAYGTWGDMVYPSSMLGFLARSTHPLAAFLALRMVPFLIRTQGADGAWHEDPIRYRDKAFPSPTAAESTYLILTALKRFGYLDALLLGDSRVVAQGRG
jgi:hypothetical protein